MKTCQPSSIALLVAMLAAPVGTAAVAAFQDPAAAPAQGDGGMNQPMELPPPAPEPAAAQDTVPGPASGRKPDSGEELVGLQFRDQEIKTLIDTISLWTGKVVIPKQTALTPVKITIVSDRKMPKSDALNLIFQAFRLNGLGVVETDDMILIDNLTELNTLQPARVLGPDVDIDDLPENGNIVVKVFRIKNTKAQQVYDRLDGTLPSYSTLQVDNNSNQIILEGDIALAKRVQRLIDLLDVTAYVDVRTKTIKLAYQDAQTISTIITDLFSARPPSGGSTSARAGQPQQPGQNRGRVPGQQQQGELVGTSEQLIVTTLPATNSMTIRAEPNIMKEIEALISVLDAPSSGGKGEIFRLYDLKFTDPLKVQTVLQSLLEGGGGGARRTGGAGARGQTGVQRVQGIGGGGGGESGADVAIANIFRIEAYPDSNRLIVVSKTPDNFKWLDELIGEIDRPLDAGLPTNIPLKHASAIELAEILNALLAQSGASATIRAPEEGLSGIDFNVASGGENGTSNTNAFTSGSEQGGAGAGQGIQFPWATARGAGEDQAEVSALVGKSRVVPNAGQNSLLILAPPEIQQSLAKIVEDLDRPGRQVMISVVLAEVQLGDDFQLGVKWGNNVAPTNPNNAVIISGDPIFTGEKTDIFPPDLGTSTLSFDVSANVVLQALAQETTVRILQQPRVFTSDNKEAKFFQGQDVPFQASSLSNLNTGGGVQANFDQIPVGIGLNVRPRITKDRNVNMQIEVLLSNVNVTSPEGVGGNPIIDRRQTNTTATVKNGQTIVLSGIRKETENKIKNKVPLLGDVPVLDWVFANTSETKAVTELLVFVTPLVVDNPDANDSNFNAEERKRLRELAKPVAEMSKDLIRKHDLLSEDGTVDAGPKEPLQPIDIPDDQKQAPAPAAPAPAAAPAPQQQKPQ
ncbi:MAG: secretin N-terminal domain-containing protein [Planctomycetota bacterium]